MEMKFRLNMGLHQKLVMTPRLQQALKLLQLPTMELETALKNELESNPILEIEEEESDRLQGENEGTEEQAAGSNETWDDFFNDGLEMQHDQHEDVSEEDFIEKAPIYHQDIGDHLLQMLRIHCEDAQILEISEYIIGSLDDRGYLTVSLEEIAHVFRVSEEVAEKALVQVQSLEPVGIGARDMSECLLLQLKARGEENSLTATLVRDYFQAMLHKKFPEIARKLKLSIKEVQEAVSLVGELDLKPGLGYSNEDPHYVTPDLIVDEVDGEYVVTLNDRFLPRLRVSKAYQEDMAKQSRETKDFIQGKTSDAQWLIKTIEMRRSTMVKVMNAIVEEQREFFDKGPQALNPLTLQQVATRIGMHESTVSRVTSQKYVQTPRGTYSLKYFFSSSLSTSGGEEVSAKAAKDRIREIIRKEDKGKPYSDQKIMSTLQDEGLVIARRTVAKYREQMGVLPARMRKEY
ncbi:MAG: RNA polymerase factor sigma-54 [Candidatus Krumholzibacteria bacterium]|jgi:RNA polymerase sigma-54 factor|nr:RNA polymerase factor sigma-54 [Candidatus Krumholzibacteria bacterium]MDP6669460.1 RNA polymerase factor sigma-54 [Candidatus Krumholzibacteria bacterium]MDP6797296.1 RNA polymerase factor sigma-54 [Candidatus Krumholzibacteria bacterium]MDP7021217.1 RNA polymerase factor sigma-54 [Candidatus Krumholzibacteria bacterium]